MLPRTVAVESGRHFCHLASQRPVVAAKARAAFSLVELLAVIAILGTLAGLLLPALQGGRESARRHVCLDNVRRAALGVGFYESARRVFPPGCDLVPRGPALPSGTQLAWSAWILPYIEERALASRIDYAKRWDAAGGNDTASDTDIDAYVCPAGLVRAPGKADYGGIAGEWLITDGVAFPGPAGFTSGILFPIDGTVGPVRAAQVSDGLSRTLLVAEAVDRAVANAAADDPDATGRWARINCFAQAAAFINTRGSDIASNHPGGAHGAFADGRTRFFDDTMDPMVLAAICTRAGGEAEASPPAGP